MSESIINLIAADKYDAAIKLIREEMKADKPRLEHWYLAALSSCYYEKYHYKKALKYAEEAYSIDPTCPVVLWHYAGVLTVLDKYDEALVIYNKIIKKGIKKLADGRCGEGQRYAEGLLDDVRYRIAWIYDLKGDKKKALRWYKLHLKYRKPRSGCLTSLDEARWTVKALEKNEVPVASEYNK